MQARDDVAGDTLVGQSLGDGRGEPDGVELRGDGQGDARRDERHLTAFRMSFGKRHDAACSLPLANDGERSVEERIVGSEHDERVGDVVQCRGEATQQRVELGIVRHVAMMARDVGSVAA